MDRKAWRLSPSTFVEPLVNSWVAWPTLIAPVPASLHLDRYQLPLLRSFVENPEVHADASASPELVCGPFAAVPPSRVPEVAALIAKTETKMAAHLQLARELDEFQRRLNEQARGLSLEAHYAHVPSSLRGCVELVYDYWQQPSVRVIEPVVYRSTLYNSDLQSLRIATLADDRARSYFLNTPRLPADERDDLFWSASFADLRVDELFRLDLTPRAEGDIRELLGLDDTCDLGHLLAPPLTRPVMRWTEPRTRIRYFGHACVLIERSGQSVLVDPFISAIPRHNGVARLSFGDLPDVIDYALVTHGHPDHFCLETLLRLRHRTNCLVVPRNAGTLYGDVSLKSLAQRIGFRHVVELDVFESLPLLEGGIVAVPFLGEHSDIGHSKTAYVVRSGSQQIFFGADSDCLDPELYSRIRHELGAVDVVFIGLESEGAIMSFAYGSLLPEAPTREQEHSRRQHGCNASRALRLCETLGARQVYHYAMGLEPWLYPVLGLNVQEGSPQWQESEDMLRMLRARHRSCARLQGTAEFLLEDNTPGLSVSVHGASGTASAPEPEGLSRSE
jgi:L-ascorbate metabolism protein UlaG (beta-lactamase superfamily)